MSDTSEYYTSKVAVVTGGASGIGLAIAASRIGSAASTFLLPVVVASLGVRTALGACFIVLAVGGLVSYALAPETRNSALDAAV